MSLTQIGAQVGPYMPWVYSVAILVGVLMFYRHYRALHEDDETTTSSSDLFATLQEARDKMTDAEFRRVRDRLIGTRQGKAESAARDSGGPRSAPPAQSQQPVEPEAQQDVEPGSAAAQ
jgi:hypothetical protein